MSGRRRSRTVLLSVLIVWIQGCLAAPLEGGLGVLVPFKNLSPRLVYEADQEGSADSEASQFSSSSGTIYSQMSSMEPSLEEALSSDIFNGQDIDSSAGDSDIVFVETDSDNEESTPVETTDLQADNSDFELEDGENEIGHGGEVSGDDLEEGESVDNEIMDITPTETDTTTSIDDNIIHGGARNNQHEPNGEDNNYLNIISSEHGNEVGDNKGHVKNDEEMANNTNETSEQGGIPGTGVMAVVMFIGAIGVGSLISFILFTVSKFFQKKSPRSNDPK